MPPRAVVALTLLLVAFPAQAAPPTAHASAPGPVPCEPTSDVALALDALEGDASPPSSIGNAQRARALEALALQHPGDFTIERALAAAAVRSDPSTLARYAAQAAARPADPRALFLHAEALRALDRPGVDPLLDRILAIDPTFPPVLHAVAEREHLVWPRQASHIVRRYLDRCPESAAALAMALWALPAPQRPAIAPRLQKRLAAGVPRASLVAYLPLWQARLPTLTSAPTDKERAAIGEDLARLRATLPPSAELLYTLAEGARLAGDPRGAQDEDALVSRFPSSPLTAALVGSRCATTDTSPARTASLEETRRRHRARYQASEACARRWSQRAEAWEARVAAAIHLPDLSPGEATALVDRALPLLGEDAPRALHLNLAQLCIDRSMRGPLVMKLLAGWDRALASELEGLSPKVASERLKISALNALRARALVLTVRGAIASNELARAETVLGELEGVVRRSHETDLGALLRATRARLLAAKGQSLEAATEGRAALRVLHDVEERDALSRALLSWWKAAGRSAEALPAFLSETRIEERPGWPLGWRAVETPLPDFRAKDLSGRTWTRDELRGKFVVLNLWATWCPPCVEELPRVKEAADQLVDRRDTVFLSISVDVDRAAVEAFADKHPLGLPVLIAEGALRTSLEDGGIPRTWVVSPRGMIVRELVGSGRGSTWVSELRARLDEAASKR